MKREIRNVILLLALAAILFAVNIWGYDLWPPDEPRFAQVAREMMQSGDYLVPHINGEPYKEKPPLLFWAIAATSWPYGDVNEYTARIPSVKAAVFTILLTYLLARKLYGTRVAFWAALVLMTNQRFWWQARFGQIDMLLTCCLSAALLCFWFWNKNRRAGWLAGFYLASAAGLYAKGPGTLVFPALLVFFFFWNNKKEWRAMHPILGAACIGLLYGAWMIPARMGASTEVGAAASHTISSDLFRQTIGRFALGVSHANPPWYYFETLPVDLLPWALFLPWVLPWVWRRRKEGPEMRFLLSWTIPAFIFFSIALGKRAIYLLPLFPVISILIARAVLDLIDGDRARWRKAIAWVWCAGALVLAAGPPALLLTPYRDAWSPALLIFSALGVFCALHAGYAALKGEARSIHGVIAAHFAAIALVAALVIFPAVNPHKSVRGICAPVRELVEAGEKLDLYSVGFTREEYIFYTKHFHKPVFTEMLDMDASQVDMLAQAKQLSKLRKTIAGAANKVPIASIDHLTQKETLALHEAVNQAFDQSGIDPAIRQAFEDAVTKKTNEFYSVFTGTGPAFMFVQEQDWRWMIAVAPQWHDLSLVHGQAAGNRDVLLVANGAGDRLLRSSPSAKR